MPSCRRPSSHSSCARFPVALVFAAMSGLVCYPVSASAATPTSVAAAQPIVLNHVTSAQALPDGMEMRSGAAVIRITALRDDLLRMRVGANGTLPEDASWAVLAPSRAATVTVQPESSARVVGFRTAKLHLAVDRATMAITVTDNDGHIIVQTEATHPIEYHGTSFRFYARSPEDEHYFGLGDKPGPLDRRNEAFTNWNTDSFGWQESTDPIYKSIPYFMTFRNGITGGLFLDNTWRTSFDFDKELRDTYSFGAEDGPFDLYILYGPSPKAVVEQWAWMTGTTPLPPMWTLGFQQSRYSYYPESVVRGIAAKLRSEHIPADAIYLDIDYQLKNRPFTVDPERFPHFTQMLHDLLAEHIRTVLITDLHLARLPGVGYKPYDEGIAGDHFVHNPDGSVYSGVVWPGPAVFPDFTQKASRDWWGTLYSDFVKDGAAGFWNDMNEPSVFGVPSKTMPDDVQHRIDEPGFKSRKATHLEIHNVFGMENSRGTFDGLRKLAPDTRPFVLTRASYAGGQRYAATWTGDNSSTWNHLRQTVPQIVNLGLSGFALSGADVGGFAGSPQPELLTRWLEIAAFQPIDRDHTSMGTNPQEPWADGTTQDLDLRRHFIETRYRLMPYIYSTAEEMSRTGLPIMRPLFLEFPDASHDRHPLDFNNGSEFLLGPDLLIAPSPYPDMLDNYQAVLPPVGWYDFWTGAPVVADDQQKMRVGNDNIPDEDLQVTLHPTIDKLPVFVRSGSIVPMQPLVQSTMEKPSGPLTLRVYPPNSPVRSLRAQQPCEGSLYLDDGISYAYQKGDFLRLGFTCQRTPEGLIIHIGGHVGAFKPWWTQYRVEIYGATGPVRSASIASGPVTAAYDSDHHRLTAVVPDDGQAIDLKLVR